MTLESARTNQTSLHLCASSEPTAWHSQLLSAQKGQPQERRLLPWEAPPSQEDKLPTIRDSRSPPLPPQLWGV